MPFIQAGSLPDSENNSEVFRSHDSPTNVDSKEMANEKLSNPTSYTIVPQRAKTVAFKAPLQYKSIHSIPLGELLFFYNQFATLLCFMETRGYWGNICTTQQWSY